MNPSSYAAAHGDQQDSSVPTDRVRILQRLNEIAQEQQEIAQAQALIYQHRYQLERRRLADHQVVIGRGAAAEGAGALGYAPAEQLRQLPHRIDYSRLPLRYPNRGEAAAAAAAAASGTSEGSLHSFSPAILSSRGTHATTSNRDRGMYGERQELRTSLPSLAITAHQDMHSPSVELQRNLLANQSANIQGALREESKITSSPLVQRPVIGGEGTPWLTHQDLFRRGPASPKEDPSESKAEEQKVGETRPHEVRVKESRKSVKKTSESSGGRETFPRKLYRILEESEQNGHDKIISWQPDGKSFMVLKPQAFVKDVMPQYFSGASKMNSFVKQLNLYGFKRVNTGPEQGSYFHPKFIRGNPDLCQGIRRPPPPSSTATG